MEKKRIPYNYKPRASNEQSLDDAIKYWLKINHLDRGYKAVGVIESWAEIMGKAIAKHTVDIRVRGKILYVKLDSSVLRNELHMGREQIVRQLNEKAGETLINDIKLIS